MYCANMTSYSITLYHLIFVLFVFLFKGKLQIYSKYKRNCLMDQWELKGGEGEKEG